MLNKAHESMQIYTHKKKQIKNKTIRTYVNTYFTDVCVLRAPCCMDIYGFR